MENLVLPPELSSAEIAARLSDERPADIVEALNRLDPSTAAQVILNLPPGQAVQVLDLPNLDCAAEIVQKLPTDRAVGLFTGMSADRVADVFRQLEQPSRSEILPRLVPDIQDTLRRLLSYPEHSAGSIMTTEFVSVPADWTIEQTL